MVTIVAMPISLCEERCGWVEEHTGFLSSGEGSWDLVIALGTGVKSMKKFAKYFEEVSTFVRRCLVFFESDAGAADGPAGILLVPPVLVGAVVVDQGRLSASGNGDHPLVSLVGGERLAA